MAVDGLFNDPGAAAITVELIAGSKAVREFHKNHTFQDCIKGGYQKVNDIVIEGLSTAVSLAVGGLGGYVVAYVTGLRAVRKGMQLILRASLNDMYVRFQQNAPTAEEKQVWQEMYGVYEHLADNGIMNAKHDEVLHMAEEVRK